ncbi:uncharacterized protein FRV6_06804 [Fusarium oxysporum]|uniref:HTH CENPB-type domain-containing protein n=1 Tax=Fusarium oxysporum TaxID=5507 RepID=A0A2H3T2D3_FUSOX|nr:uncharacterized protein FRV6_06804 [Fusarium oxysporum]
MSCDREYRVSSAMEELKTQPLQPTAKKYAISRGSLRNRQKGGTNARDAQIERQKLSEEQEEFLVEWILNEEAAARAPTKKNIRLFGNLILKYDNQDQQLGNHWVNRFLTRHPDIKMKLSRSIDAIQTRETTEEQLERFYKLLARQMEEKNIGAGSLYNIDKHGVAKGETKKGKLREEAWKPTGRKAVDYDPNERFAQIPEIASAHFQAENADSVARARLQPQLQRNSIAVAESGMEKLLYNFQFIPN